MINYLTGSYEIQREKSNNIYDNYPNEWENDEQVITTDSECFRGPQVLFKPILLV